MLDGNAIWEVSYDFGPEIPLLNWGLAQCQRYDAYHTHTQSLPNSKWFAISLQFCERDAIPFLARVTVQWICAKQFTYRFLSFICWLFFFSLDNDRFQWIFGTTPFQGKQKLHTSIFLPETFYQRIWNEKCMYNIVVFIDFLHILQPPGSVYSIIFHHIRMTSRYNATQWDGDRIIIA